MRTGIASALLWIALAGSVPLGAQWLHYPTKHVPHTRDGKPDLAAPAPRTADGHPDFSGIWALDPPPCPPGGCGDYPAAREFMNLGAHLAGGLPYRPFVAAMVKKRTADQGRDDPVARCLPAGAVRLLTFPPPRKILQSPDEIVILSERDVTFQQIFTDGRPLPGDPAPTPNGYSVGQWQGDTLVVESIGFRDGTWLDRNGSPLSDEAKITERFHRANFGLLEVAMTVNDPKYYTHPWTVTLKQRIVLDTELLDYYCQDNEKDAVHVTR